MAIIPNPKGVRLLAEEIERLEEELSIARRKWAALFGDSINTSGRRESNSATLTGRAEKWINDHPDTDHKIARVADAIGESSLQVGRVLYRLQMDGRIRAPRRGHYQALEKEVPSEEKTS